MYDQITVRIKSTDRKVFIKRKPLFASHTSPIHCHHYTEVHFLLSGNIEFQINGKQYKITSGNIFVIPEKLLHSCEFVSEDCRWLSLFLDCNITCPTLLKSNIQLLNEFLEYAENLNTNDYSKLAAFISLLCNDLFEDEMLVAEKTQDYALVIEDFFSVNYSNNVRLSDLADILHLSEKQTERLIMKYTGKTFKQKISHQRIKIAKILIKENKMSLKEIAEYVGYNSYSGFWKALKQYDTPI